MTVRAPDVRDVSLALPLAGALLIPMLPLVVQLADIFPAGVAILGRGVAVALVVVLGVAGLASMASILIKHGWHKVRRAPLAKPLLVLIATQAIAAIIGVSFRAGEFEILSQIGDVIAFLTFWFTMAKRGARRAFLACFFLSGIAACVYAIALTLSRHPPAAFAYEHGRAAGTFLQPNELAGYLLFLIPLGLAQIAAPLWLRRLGFAAAVVGGAALVLSVSRAAWLGLLLALPIFTARLGRRALAGYAVAALILLTLGATVLRNVAHDPSENTSRITVWRSAIRMAERFGLTGLGPVAFGRVYPMLKEPDAINDVLHAHNLLLNVFIENGIIGFAAFIWVIVASVRAARHAGKQIPSADRERVLLFSSLSTAFAASAVQNSIDLITTFVLLLWWPMLGLMLALARDERTGANSSEHASQNSPSTSPMRPPALHLITAVCTISAVASMLGACGKGNA
ncbi:MAG: O-antigen ligase family protein, partial [Candidatus Eremiobacteraeota bacterium]|nr:O-antigen ligase family protein [Candidatus Eremiobacteraeota bacterium]